MVVIGAECCEPGVCVSVPMRECECLFWLGIGLGCLVLARAIDAYRGLLGFCLLNGLTTLKPGS